VRALLLDADDCLFPSEGPAFEASTEVVNRFLERLGSSRRYRAADLRLAAAGRNFRGTATELAAAAGVTIDASELDDWVAEEQRAVTARLRAALKPDPSVKAAVERLGARFELAVVSSSALARIDACLQVTGLAALLERRFSAEDSLPVPTSKPDPAVYVFALEALGVRPNEALAVEDSVSGARAAVGAGIETIGNVCFVPARDRAARVRALQEVGVAGVVDSWDALVTR